MIVTALLAGVICGLVVMFTFFRAGMLAERSGIAVFLITLALFYPVFAAATQDYVGMALHIVIFLGFVALAITGFRHGLHLLAGGFIAHGVFDVGLYVLGAPGPVWWPLFCAGISVTAAVVLVRFMQTGKIE